MWDYSTALTKSREEKTWDYMSYIKDGDKSKSKTAIKRKIIDLKQELEKLSKEL